MVAYSKHVISALGFLRATTKRD